MTQIQFYLIEMYAISIQQNSKNRKTRKIKNLILKIKRLKINFEHNRKIKKFY